jgi:hypothetical protein
MFPKQKGGSQFNLAAAVFLPPLANARMEFTWGWQYDSCT